MFLGNILFRTISIFQIFINDSLDISEVCFLCLAWIFLYVLALFDFSFFSSNSMSDIATSKNLKLELILMLLFMSNTLGWFSIFLSQFQQDQLSV